MIVKLDWQILRIKIAWAEDKLLLQEVKDGEATKGQAGKGCYFGIRKEKKNSLENWREQVTSINVFNTMWNYSLRVLQEMRVTANESRIIEETSLAD